MSTFSDIHPVELVLENGIGIQYCELNGINLVADDSSVSEVLDFIEDEGPGRFQSIRLIGESYDDRFMNRLPPLFENLKEFAIISGGLTAIGGQGSVCKSLSCVEKLDFSGCAMLNDISGLSTSLYGMRFEKYRCFGELITLNVQHTAIESVELLANLKVLNAGGCEYLANIRGQYNLRMLNLRGTAVERLPSSLSDECGVLFPEVMIGPDSSPPEGWAYLNGCGSLAYKIAHLSQRLRGTRP